MYSLNGVHTLQLLFDACFLMVTFSSMVIQGRQCTGANTTPLGALNPLFTGERRQERPEGASLLLPHLANQPPNPNAPSWTPPVQVKKEQSPNKRDTRKF